ncbi:MAG: 50S ribosomal protein L9 [Chlamydiales bacterium]|nr:50S ribosomal protein L9 [Chlamydiales bacterium]
MKQQLLLLEDVDGLGRSGEVVTAKPGFIRNFLLPQKKAVIADKNALKMQARLQEEREKKAAVDRKEAQELSSKLAEVVISTEAKIDPDGKMYGSVTSLDIARLMQAEGHPIERKHVLLSHPIKTLGRHKIELKLNEGVPASFMLEVIPEGGQLPVQEEVVAPVEEELSETSKQ